MCRSLGWGRSPPLIAAEGLMTPAAHNYAAGNHITRSHHGSDAQWQQDKTLEDRLVVVRIEFAPKKDARSWPINDSRKRKRARWSHSQLSRLRMEDSHHEHSPNGAGCRQSDYAPTDR